MRKDMPSRRARHRTVQLREAKQRQRARQREAGLVACQVVVPRAIAEPLREAAKRTDLLSSLQRWLALEIVDLEAWPQLRSLAWGRHDRWISGADALATYERNWRFVEPDALTAAEAELIRNLALRHGNGVLLV